MRGAMPAIPVASVGEQPSWDASTQLSEVLYRNLLWRAILLLPGATVSPALLVRFVLGPDKAEPPYEENREGRFHFATDNKHGLRPTSWVNRPQNACPASPPDLRRFGGAPPTAAAITAGGRARPCPVCCSKSVAAVPGTLTPGAALQ